MKLKQTIAKYERGLLFVTFGVCTTIVDYGVYFIFAFIVGEANMLKEAYYLSANLVSWAFAVLFAYITNKTLVFKSRSWKIKVLAKEVPTFFGTRFVALLVSELGIWLLVSKAGLNRFTVDRPLCVILGYAVAGDIIAKFIMSFISTALNYLFGRFIIFRKKGRISDLNADTGNENE